MSNWISNWSMLTRQKHSSKEDTKQEWGWISVRAQMLPVVVALPRGRERPRAKYVWRFRSSWDLKRESSSMTVDLIDPLVIYIGYM